MYSLLEILDTYRVDLIAVQEINRTGKGTMELKKNKFSFYFSCQEKKHKLGCGFIVGPKLKSQVIDFKPINDRLCTIRLKARFFNISLICCHAPTEDKDDLVKEEFYDMLEKAYDNCPGHDVKMVVGDFNAQIGKEDIFGGTTGKFTIHQTTNENGHKLIQFAALKNLTVESTKFKHLNIHLGTWMHPNPELKSVSQIDHVLVDRRHGSSVMDVRSWRGANIDSDHFLVIARYRARISRQARSSNITPRKLNIDALKTPSVSEDFASKVSERLNEHSTLEESTVNEHWRHIKASLTAAAENSIGHKQPQPKNPWFDEECQLLSTEKNEARKKYIQSKTRASYRMYSQLRGELRRLIKKKKRAHEKKQFEELAALRDRNEVRKFYKKVTNITQGHKQRTIVCRSKQGELITEINSIRERWAEHFKEHLDGAIPPVNNAITFDPLPLTEAEDHPSLEEVREAISSLKNNKSTGTDNLPAEIFKHGGPILLEHMHSLICKIWIDERMPDEWRMCTITPVHKKGDKLECSNYRCIGLLNVAYKILSKIICNRMEPHMRNTIGNYQCGFRPGKSTIDQMFALRQIMEKTREFNRTTHHLFIDFKAAYDTIDRQKFFDAMAELNFPAKLINLSKMILACTLCAVKVENGLSSYFQTHKGFIQGDGISCSYFNIALEKIIRDAEIVTHGTIFNKCQQILGYADDIDIIGWTKEDVEKAFLNLEQNAQQMGLKVNETKTKYMLATKNDNIRRRATAYIKMGRYNFEAVENFIYLGGFFNTEGDGCSLEINRRIIMATRCFYGLQKLMRSKTLSKNSKLTLYKTLVIPVLMYGAETWTMTKKDENQLGVFERKILRMIVGPKYVNGIWRRKYNAELYEEYGERDIVEKIKIQRLRWLGHVARMDDSCTTKKVFDAKPQGPRSRGKPRLRWKDSVESDVKRMKLNRPWREVAQDRARWRRLLKLDLTPTG